MYSDTLDDLRTINGVGRSKIIQLKKAGFEDIDDVRQASPEEIAATDGIGPVMARRIANRAACMSGATLTTARDDLETALLELADELGRTPTKPEMRDLGAYSPDPYAREWGSWNEALKANGLDVNRRTVQSDEEYLEEIRRVADELGHTPTCQEFDEVSAYSAGSAAWRFLGWVHACHEAELDLSNVDSPSRDHLAEVLQILAIELGREPTPDDMDEYGPYPSSLYERAFDSWRQAVFYAGVHQESGLYDDDMHTKDDSARGEFA